MLSDIKIIKLETHSDKRGYFREIIRFKEQFEDIEIGQISHSLVNEGIIKAWHGHKYQYQWNYVFKGEIEVALYDNRKESKTYGELFELNISSYDPLVYFFPPGIFHGYKCIKGPMEIFYVTSGIYDLSDELRKSSINIKHEYNYVEK